jgi:ribokinase
MAVLVFGGLNIDLVVYVDRLPAAGETLIGNDYKEFAGGKGLNQAIAARRAGSEVAMVGAIGDNAEILTSLLAEEKLDTTYLLHKPGPSGTALIEVDGRGENRIIVIPGANGQVRSRDFSDSLFNQREKILLGQLEMNLPEVESIFARAKGYGFKTILNPSPVAELSPTFLQNVDLMVANQHEAELLTGIQVRDRDSGFQAADRIMDQGVHEVVITLSRDGAIYKDSQCQIFQPAFSVIAVDTTGAGDAFCGALVSTLADGGSIEDALRFAATAGALSVTKEGSSPSLPRRAEISSFLESQERH